MRIIKSGHSYLGGFSFLVLAIMFTVGGYNLFHYIISVFFIILAILAFTYTSGIEINSEKEIRNFTSFFGHRFGEWKKILEIDYITVVRLNQYKWISTGVFLGQEPSNNKIYSVRIVLKNGNPRFIKLVSTKKSKALEYAKELGNLIGTKVLNYT